MQLLAIFAIAALVTLTYASPAPGFIVGDSPEPAGSMDGDLQALIVDYGTIQVHAEEFVASRLNCKPAIIARADFIRIQDRLAIMADKANFLGDRVITFSPYLLFEVAMRQARALMPFSQRVNLLESPLVLISLVLIHHYRYWLLQRAM
jgi:hypothetical protein